MTSEHGAGSARLLLIEADPTTAEAVALLLERECYQVTLASTGEAGLALLDEQPSLVILDVVLPDMDGYHVCQSITSRDPLLPVLILSAASDVRQKVRGLDAGADDCLAKPFSEAELLARVKAALAKHATQRLLAEYGQQLQLVGEIGRRITSILGLDSLLWEVIRLTQRAFDLGFIGNCRGHEHIWRWSQANRR